MQPKARSKGGGSTPASHAVFSHPAVEILQDSLEEIVVTDGIHLPPEKQIPN